MPATRNHKAGAVLDRTLAPLDGLSSQISLLAERIDTGNTADRPLVPQARNRTNRPGPRLPPSRATRYGTVSGPGGQALPGATVTVNDGNGQPVEEAVSGTDGHYKIYDPTPGEYTVVTSPFEPAVRQVDLGSGESATVDLHLNTRARDDVGNHRGSDRVSDRADALCAGAAVTLVDSNGRASLKDRGPLPPSGDGRGPR